MNAESVTENASRRSWDCGIQDFAMSMDASGIGIGHESPLFVQPLVMEKVSLEIHRVAPSANPANWRIGHGISAQSHRLCQENRLSSAYLI
jgi:hypothetical protein